MMNRRVVLGLGAGLAITAGAHRDSHAQAPAAGRVTALVGRAKATAVTGSERGLAEGEPCVSPTSWKPPPRAVSA
jgi:hypothetical protein